MNFQPDQPKEIKVPYFEDALAKDGWQGQATRKTINKLQNEIQGSIQRLGGFVIVFQSGTFGERAGFRVHIGIANEGANMPGYIDIAALPSKVDTEKSREKSLKMALYMLREALDGQWLLQQLSPGLAPLMPFMMADGQRNITQAWSETAVMAALLPPGGGEFVEDKPI